jgi:hypothetical protein
MELYGSITYDAATNSYDVSFTSARPTNAATKTTTITLLQTGVPQLERRMGGAHAHKDTKGQEGRYVLMRSVSRARVAHP